MELLGADCVVKFDSSEAYVLDTILLFSAADERALGMWKHTHYNLHVRSHSSDA